MRKELGERAAEDHDNLPSERWSGQTGKLLGIATRPALKAPMHEMSLARITTEQGVEGDVRGKPGRRQVTVISSSAWDTVCSEIKAGRLPWTTRRANLLVDGVELKGKIGYDLRIGSAVLTITGETRPCERMNQACAGLMLALKPDWRGGVTCRVSRSGDVAVGCDVSLTRNPIRQLAWITRVRTKQLLKRGRRLLG